MNQKGVDYSFARPDLKAIKANGYSFICRYLSADESKSINASEKDDIQANNLSLVLVYEDDAQAPLGGYDRGREHGWNARFFADKIGFPSDGTLPIYFAVDFDTTEAQQETIDQYLKGAAEALGNGRRVGVYGSFYVVERCYANKTADYFWQTVAWSGGQVSEHAHIFQNGETDFNGTCDVDIALKDDFGAWNNKKGNTMNEADVKAAFDLVLQRSPKSDQEWQKYVGWTFLQFANEMAPGYEYKLIKDIVQSRYPNMQQQVKDLEGEVDSLSKSLRDTQVALQQTASTAPKIDVVVPSQTSSTPPSSSQTPELPATETTSPLKAGWKTSEFWLHGISVFMSGLLAIPAGSPGWFRVFSAALGVLSATGYTINRSNLKKAIVAALEASKLNTK